MWRFAAKFQIGLGQVISHTGGNSPARIAAAGKRDLGYPFVTHQALAGAGAAPGHHIKDPIGKAGFFDQFGKGHSACRGVL